MIKTKGLLKEIPGFIPDIPYIEVEHEDVEFSLDQYREPDVLTVDENNRIQPHQADPKNITSTFEAFIDGTYKIVKIGYLYGVPFYVSNIAGALLWRDSNGFLHDFGDIGSFLVILYPFEAVMDYLYENNHREDAQILEEKIDTFRKEYSAINDCELRRDTLSVISDKSSPIYVISDITYKGLDCKKREKEKIEYIDIDCNDVFNISRIKAKAQIRTRVLMSILEATYLRAYREKMGTDKWVLMDGTLNHSFKYSFSKTKESEKEKIFFENTVGFVKTIRRRIFTTKPEKLIQLLSFKEDQYIITLEEKNDSKEEELSELDEKIIGKWGFVYLRFRYPHQYIGISSLSKIFTPKGIIKAQYYIPNYFSNNEEIKRYALKKGKIIADMLSFEKYPYPSDRRRIWNEPLAIEETEKVAKSRTLSEEFLMHLGSVL